MASTMQLQLATAQTRRVCRPAPKAFVAVPVARRAALQQCAARSPARKVVVKAVAEAQAPAATSTGAQEWWACVASADFFYNDVQNEPFAEQLREKKRFLDEQGKEYDFYLVSQPAWLEEKFPAEAKRVRKPAVALISTDPVWITFMKLRLDRVLKLDLGKMSVEDATKSLGPIPEFPPRKDWIAPYAPYAHGWWTVFERK